VRSDCLYQQFRDPVLPPHLTGKPFGERLAAAYHGSEAMTQVEQLVDAVARHGIRVRPCLLITSPAEMSCHTAAPWCLCRTCEIMLGRQRAVTRGSSEQHDNSLRCPSGSVAGADRARRE
jgi:hypothetical protein